MRFNETKNSRHACTTVSKQIALSTVHAILKKFYETENKLLNLALIKDNTTGMNCLEIYYLCYNA